MKIQNITFIFLLFFCFLINAQDMSEYTDNWEGKIENSKIFNIKVEILNIKSEKAFVRISNTKNNIDFPVPINLNNNSIKIAFSENFSFEGVLSKDNKEINGFIKSGLLLYHLKLTQSNHNSYVGNWNILMIDELKSQDLYLSIENGLQNEYQAYPILGDNRFTGTWCDNFQKDNNVISFLDFKTGLHFKGKLEDKKIQLNIFLGNFLISEIDLKRSQSDWKIGDFKIENTNSVLKLTEMEDLIFKDSLPNTHSVLISRKGKLLYENYFNGYTATIPHDMRSASKSISSAIIGIALDKSLFKNVNQSIFDFLSPKYQTQKDSLKAKINIQSLLTMSSGLDAIDYGKNANSKSPATEENFQRTTDWTRSVLSASMINAPNTQANYGSANPYLLGIAMDSIINEPLELFMDRNLFQKLHISNYIIQTDLKGKPYFGGGMYLTPRDMLSFGELYLNYGKWNSKRIISRKWVKDSFKNHHALENTIDKNGYGYLWWHNTYFSKGKKIKTIEARGAGGQYIFIIPSLKVVVVITSGNFRNGKTQQPEKIFEDYILPNIKK